MALVFLANSVYDFLNPALDDNEKEIGDDGAVLDAVQIRTFEDL